MGDRWDCGLNVCVVPPRIYLSQFTRWTMLYEGIARKSEDYVRRSPSESTGDSRMTWRTSRMMRTKLRDVGGPEDVYIRTRGLGTCGLLYYEDRSTGANSETYYISNFKEFHHMCLCNFHGTKKQQQKRALWVMGTLPMANRTEGAGRGDVRTKVRGV